MSFCTDLLLDDIIQIMYIRKVVKGNGHTDKKYELLHLIESIRTEEDLSVY